MNTCSGCDASWGGNNTAHCSGCHATFTGLTAFDKHRTGSHVKRPGRYCLDAATAVDDNLEYMFREADRKYLCWGLAGDKPTFWEDE